MSQGLDGFMSQSGFTASLPLTEVAMPATWKVDGSGPSVATIRSAQLLGPSARPLTPHCSWGDCPLLTLINCKSLWIKASAKYLMRMLLQSSVALTLDCVDGCVENNSWPVGRCE